jgi:uncharacterized protein YciI
VSWFAVICTHGGAWQPGLPLESQAGWEAHAAFMDRLEAESFVVLGGPLEGTEDVLLVVRASDRAEIMDRLAEDPWSRDDLLRVSRVSPWTVRLNSVARFA